MTTRPQPQVSLVIVTGLPAAGKSRFAARLAGRTGWPLLAKDAIKEPLLQALGPVDALRSRSLSDLSFALQALLAPLLLGHSSGLILEGNFRSGEHEVLLEGSVRAAARTAQVLCRVSESLRLQRLEARAGDVSRHAGHRLIMGAAAADRRADAHLALESVKFVLPGDAPDVDCDAMIDTLLAIVG